MGRAESRLVSLAFPEVLDGLLDFGVGGEVVIFLGRRVGKRSKIQEGLVVGFAPISDLGIDLVFRFRIGLLALELVEPGRLLADLGLELISIEHELVVLFLGVSGRQPTPKPRNLCHPLAGQIDLRLHLIELVFKALDGLFVLLGAHGSLLLQDRVAQLPLEPPGIGELGFEVGLVFEDLEGAGSLQLLFFFSTSLSCRSAAAAGTPVERTKRIANAVDAVIRQACKGKRRERN